MTGGSKFKAAELHTDTQTRGRFPYRYHSRTMAAEIAEITELKKGVVHQFTCDEERCSFNGKSQRALSNHKSVCSFKKHRVMKAALKKNGGPVAMAVWMLDLINNVEDVDQQLDQVLRVLHQLRVVDNNEHDRLMFFTNEVEDMVGNGVEQQLLETIAACQEDLQTPFPFGASAEDPFLNSSITPTSNTSSASSSSTAPSSLTDHSGYSNVDRPTIREHKFVHVPDTVPVQHL